MFSKSNQPCFMVFKGKADHIKIELYFVLLFFTLTLKIFVKYVSSL